jgi:hypothetical protein
MLIGAGGSNDSASIPLATKRGTFIPNERRRERSPDSLKAAVDTWTRKYPNIQLRSLTATYNCVGLVFACRRTCIDPAHLKMILTEDNYRRLSGESEVEIGDLVLYRATDDEYSHIAVVVKKEPNIINASFEITVVSQWGFDGEYIHLIDEVPDSYGKIREFWTDRRTSQ